MCDSGFSTHKRDPACFAGAGEHHVQSSPATRPQVLLLVSTLASKRSPSTRLHQRDDRKCMAHAEDCAMGLQGHTSTSKTAQRPAPNAHEYCASAQHTSLACKFRWFRLVALRDLIVLNPSSSQHSTEQTAHAVKLQLTINMPTPVH
jgi:hypothetical protein